MKPISAIDGLNSVHKRTRNKAQVCETHRKTDGKTEVSLVVRKPAAGIGASSHADHNVFLQTSASVREMVELGLPGKLT